jgi:TetR/AcrR family transcriptional regulator
VTKKAVRLSLRDLEKENERFLSPATEKEKAIIDAAVKLFGERGIDGATTAQIAKLAGVTEKTLFRYFPSKGDLIKRVLFPSLLRDGLNRSWETLEALLKQKNPDFKEWYRSLSTARLAVASKNPPLTRTLLMEIVENDELRTAVSALWQVHVRQPLAGGLKGMQDTGTIRKEINVETLARVIQCMNIGYFITRYIFAPSADWDDEAEIEWMGDILAHGSCVPSRGGTAKGNDKKK